MVVPFIAAVVGAILSIYVRVAGWNRLTPEGEAIALLSANWPLSIVLLVVALVLSRSEATSLLGQVLGVAAAFWIAFVAIGPAMLWAWRSFSPPSL